MIHPIRVDEFVDYVQVVQLKCEASKTDEQDWPSWVTVMFVGAYYSVLYNAEMHSIKILASEK